MDIEIRLFATLKDRAGRERVQVEVTNPATVATVKAALATAYPVLAPAVDSALVAVNREFAFDHSPVTTEDEIALFPPVSGGQDGAQGPTYFALTETAPDVVAIIRRLTTPDIGAVVFFHGSVRGETQRDGLPPETIYLEYEAYIPMAERKMAQIAREIWERWPGVQGIAIVQRTGRLAVGEMTTLVACAAGHRDQGAFEAARYGIDRLKEIVPVWKKEVGKDRTVWIEGNYQPTPEDVSTNFPANE